MRIRDFAALILALPLSLAFLSEAQAQTCLSGCGVQAKACIQAARADGLACKADCKANAAPEDLDACMATCATTFRSAKQTCRAGIVDCVSGCVAMDPNGDNPCMAACGQDLATCAGAVIADARACVAPCKTADDRLACLGACVTVAKSAARVCASDFGTCATGCGVTPPTTVPTATSCWGSEAPTCGGTCALPNTTCTPILGHCACIPSLQ